MFVTIPKDTKLKFFVDPKPAWIRDSAGEIWIRCQCGRLLGLDHEILPDGTITPSLHHDDPNCGWHVYGKLVDYDG